MSQNIEFNFPVKTDSVDEFARDELVRIEGKIDAVVINGGYDDSALVSAVNNNNSQVSLLVPKVNNMEAAIYTSGTGLQDKTLANTNAITDITQDLIDVNGTLTTLSTQVNSVVGIAATLQTNQSNLTNTVNTNNTTLTNELNATKARLPVLETFVSNYTPYDDSDLKQDVGEIDDQIIDVYDTLNLHDGRITAAKNLADSNSVSIGTINGKVTSLESSRTAQNTLNGTVDTRLNNVESVNVTQNSRLTTAEGTISSQGSTLASHTSSINSLNSTVSGHTTSINTNTSDISTLNTSMNTATSNISSLTTRVGTVESTTGTLNSTVTGLTNSVNTLNSQNLDSRLTTCISATNSNTSNLSTLTAAHTITRNKADSTETLANTLNSQINNPSTGLVAKNTSQDLNILANSADISTLKTQMGSTALLYNVTDTLAHLETSHYPEYRSLRDTTIGAADGSTAGSIIARVKKNETDIGPRTLMSGAIIPEIEGLHAYTHGQLGVNAGVGTAKYRIDAIETTLGASDGSTAGSIQARLKKVYDQVGDIGVPSIANAVHINEINLNNLINTVGVAASHGLANAVYILRLNVSGGADYVNANSIDSRLGTLESSSNNVTKYINTQRIKQDLPLDVDGNPTLPTKHNLVVGKYNVSLLLPIGLQRDINSVESINNNIIGHENFNAHLIDFNKDVSIPYDVPARASGTDRPLYFQDSQTIGNFNFRHASEIYQLDNNTIGHRNFYRHDLDFDRKLFYIGNTTIGNNNYFSSDNRMENNITIGNNNFRDYKWKQNQYIHKNVIIGNDILKSAATSTVGYPFEYNTLIGHEILNNYTQTDSRFEGNVIIGRFDDSGGAGVNIFRSIFISGGGTLIGTGKTDSLDAAIRIGNSAQNACYIGGIANKPVSGGSPVYIDSWGKLGFNSSSIAVKDVIKYIENYDDVLDKLLECKVAKYTYKDDETKQACFGMIAEDMESKDLQELVAYNEDGSIQGVKYHHIYNGLLLALIKRHENKIKNQQNVINLLKGRLEAIEAHLGL